MQSDSQEINISQIISAILNKKREGLLVFFIVVFVGIGLTFVLPRTYQATEILQLAMVDRKQTETVDALKTLFQSETKLNEIADELGLPLALVEKNFSIESKAGGAFVAIKGRGENPEEAMKITKLVSAEILEREEQLYKPVQEKSKSEIITLEENKKSTEQKIAQSEKIIEGLQNDIAFYQREIEKRSEAQSEAQGRIAETYIKLLAETKRSRDVTANELTNLKQQLFVLEENIQQKKFIYSYLSGPARIEISALMPKKSFIPSNIVQNIIYSVVLGIFLAIVWIFIRTFHIRRQTM